MRPLLLALIVSCASTGCAKKETPPGTAVGNEEPAFAVNPKFAGGESVILTARKVFPESGQISLSDFWTSADSTHEFVVFFAGREIKGGFESMYWRYLVFAKKKTDRDWSSARVFDLLDDHPKPLGRTLEWLEKNAKELKAPNQSLEPTAPSGRGSP